MRAALRFLAAVLALAALAPPAFAQTPARVSDLTLHPGNVPRRLVGYGIVTGLDGTGDRSFGSLTGGTPSVRSVVNLLRRFGVQVPPEQLRLRDVAAVVITAEVSPWLRAGGRFDVQVSALGDASSLRGGVLFVAPLVADPEEPPVATAQGVLYLAADDPRRGGLASRGNSGRVPGGGLLEADPESLPAPDSRLLLRRPDLSTASRIAAVINAAFGENTATVQDPGSLLLQPPGGATETSLGFLAAVDTLSVVVREPARIVIDGREGTIVAGGGIQVGPAVIHRMGLTLEIGGPAPAGGSQADSTGRVRVGDQASVRDVAAGLHAAGLKPSDMAAIFEALRASGAVVAEVLVR